jgi:hypothetical protein
LQATDFQSKIGAGQAAGAASGRPRIVVLLPRGEAIRNFVYTGALDRLSKTAEVAVLSVIPSDELRDVLSGGAFSLLPLRHVGESYVVGAIRDLLDMAHGRKLWSKAAQERWYLRDQEATTPAARLKRSAKKMLCVPFANGLGVTALSRAERLASRWFRTTDEFTRLFEQLRPSLVFNASHVHGAIAIQAVQAAQWLNIPTATFLFSWDNLTSQGRILPAYDHYLVWNDAIRRQLMSIYPDVRAEQVAVTGTPQFDFHFRPEFHQDRESFCATVGADPARPILLYSTGMANHMPGEHLIVERIGDMMPALPGNPQLLVRVYPKDLTGRFDEVKRRRKDILFPPAPWEPAFLTPKYDDLLLLTNTLRHCAAGINIASTVALELAMLDKPAINVGYNPPGLDIHPISFARYYDFDHYKSVVASGAVEVAWSEDGLKTILADALLRPEKRRAERQAFIRSMFGDTLDGASSDRVANALLRLATAGGGWR